MRRCCNNRRRRCRRPPLRVRIGDQPFQVKQMAYETDNDDWCFRPWEDDECDSCSSPPPPWFDDDDMPPPFPPPPPRGIGLEENAPEFADLEMNETGDRLEGFDNSFSLENENEEENLEAFRPPRPGHQPWPPHHWPPRPRHCNGCNMKIKVFKFDACRRPKADVVIGLYFRGRLVRTAETNERGEAIFSYLHPGLYTVRELEVPEGVEEDTTRFAVFLNESCTSAIVVFKKGRCRVDCPNMGRWWPENPHHQ